MSYPSRERALALLQEHTKSSSLRAHALGVEAAMRAYAERFGEDPDVWGVVGLLHDFDYEKYPDPKDHPYRGVEILRAEGAPEEMLRAILSHAAYTGVPRETRMAKTLFAVDELCGFISAVALVRPSKRVAEVTPRSVKKKMKAAAFARNVSRDDIRSGTEELGVELDEHIQTCVAALAKIAGEIGLAGSPEEPPADTPAAP